MWGLGFSLALAAAFLPAAELGIGHSAAQSRVSRALELDPPFAWDETLPGTMGNWTNDALEPACESGFWLWNHTCTRCPLGFGGATCQDPLLLALVGVSCFAGLLLVLLLALLLFRRALPAQETPMPLPLPLHSRVLSLPRVRPPGSVPELGDCPPSALDPELGGQLAARAPQMKTFWGSRGPPPLAPQTVGGCSNLVFIGDAGEPAERDCF